MMSILTNRYSYLIKCVKLRGRSLEEELKTSTQRLMLAHGDERAAILEEIKLQREKIRELMELLEKWYSYLEREKKKILMDEDSDREFRELMEQFEFYLKKNGIEQKDIMDSLQAAIRVNQQILESVREIKGIAVTSRDIVLATLEQSKSNIKALEKLEQEPDCSDTVKRIIKRFKEGQPMLAEIAKAVSGLAQNMGKCEEIFVAHGHSYEKLSKSLNVGNANGMADYSVLIQGLKQQDQLINTQLVKLGAEENDNPLLFQFKDLRDEIYDVMQKLEQQQLFERELMVKMERAGKDEKTFHRIEAEVAQAISVRKNLVKQCTSLFEESNHIMNSLNSAAHQNPPMVSLYRDFQSYSTSLSKLPKDQKSPNTVQNTHSLKPKSS